MKKLQTSVLVVEDEPIILKNICKKIEDLDIGISVVATALNGKEALKKIYHFQPDFLITDIRMPVMDGIALMEHVRSIFPEMPLVVISGYSDFEYMQRCIELSVDGYILKPVNAGQLGKTMQKVLQVLNERHSSRTKEILTSNVLLGKNNEAVPSGLEEERFHLILVNVGNYALRMLNASQVDLIDRVWETINWEGIMRELEPGCEWWVIDEYLYNQKFIMFTSADKAERIHSTVRRLKKILSQYIDEYPVSFSYTKRPVAYSLIKDQADSLRSRMKEGICLCMSTIIEPLDQESSPGRDEVTEIILPGADFSNLGKYRDEFLASGRKWQNSLTPQMTVIKNIHRFLEDASKRDLSYSSTNGQVTMNRIEEQIVLERDPELLYDRIWQLICESMQERTVNMKETRQIVDGIRRYFEQHYDEEISLSVLAEELHFTAAYLSKIFKKYTGETPVHYLQNVRISQAKELLSGRQELSVQSIARMTGYDNVHYFSRVFKNETGMTPSEYREC